MPGTRTLPTLSFSVSFSVAGQPQREYENFCRAINYATKLLYKRRVSNMAAKGIGQVPEWACSGHRKLLSKLWPGREITETLALYERLETELQETATEAGNRRREKQRLSGNCTRNAAGPKLSQHIQLQSFFFIFSFYCWAVYADNDSKNFVKHFSCRDKCADKRFRINSIVCTFYGNLQLEIFLKCFLAAKMLLEKSLELKQQDKKAWIYYYSF